MNSKLNRWGVDFSIGLFALIAYIFGIPWLKKQVTDFINDPENPLVVVLSLIPKDTLDEVNRFIVSFIPNSSKPLVESILNEIASKIHDDDIIHHTDRAEGDNGEEVRAPLFKSQ